jgi:hypothetical protein
MHTVWVTLTVAGQGPRTPRSTRRRGVVGKAEDEERCDETEDHMSFIANKARLVPFMPKRKLKKLAWLLSSSYLL